MRLSRALAACVTAGALLALGCERRAPTTDRTAPTAPVDPLVQAGAATFARYCALCHGADAKGYAADHAPSLVSSTFLESASDDFLAGSIERGRPGTAMAGYAKARGGPLGDEEVRGVIAFLRSKGPRLAETPLAPARGTAVWGEELYQRECQTCHGTRLRRGTAPWLANPEFLALASDEFLRHAVTRGRPGTDMRAFAGALHREQIEDLVSMLRAWQTTPPEPPPLPPAMPGMEGPIVIHPEGKAPTWKARDGRFVAIDDVKRALDERRRMIILDARATSDWLQVHVKGSVSAPYYEPARLDAVPDDGTWVLAYCACPHHASGVVVDELKRRGYPNVAIMDEGILEWQNRKYPVVRAKGASPPPAPPRR
ncbi:MAG: c-type cytochrome [Polyangiaceae bacterium]|nr:c-type cytochrome [Polyangiaceae bacterium]